MSSARISEIYPYGELRALAPGLHCMDGTWKKSPLARRMTVLRSASGELAIHSAIRLTDSDYARIVDRLGRVTLILVPSSLHGDEARFYAERYPQAAVYVPAPVRDKCAAKLPRVDATYADALPAAWARELAVLQAEGTRMGEALFLHIPSRTMIATDLVIHYTDQLTGFTRSIMKWNGALGRVGPTRIFRWFFLRNRAAFTRSLQPVRGWEFDRIVMSHGTILEHDGKRLFVDGFLS